MINNNRSPPQQASIFLDSLPNNNSSSSTITYFQNLITLKFSSFTKFVERRILENERTRKFTTKTKEFFEFLGDFSRKDLLDNVLKQWKLALMCFVFGIVIGFFFLSVHGGDDDNGLVTDARMKNTFSFPLPDGFNEKETLQDNFDLLRHFYLTSSRQLLKYEGGHLDAFANSVATIKDIDSILLFKNYTLKSKPILLKDLGIGWKAKREWYKIDYLIQNYKKEEMFSVEKNKYGIFHEFNFDNVDFELMNFKTFIDQSARKKLLLSIDLSRLPHLQHDIPKWPSVINGFYTLISIHALISTGKTTRLLKSNNYETVYCQIVGKSELLLFNPFQTDLIYPNKSYPNHARFNPYNLDFKKYPLSRYARPLKTKLSEGDCLLIPSYWFYSVRSLSDVGENSLNPTDLNIIIEYYYSTISNAHKVSFESILRGQ